MIVILIQIGALAIVLSLISSSSYEWGVNIFIILIVWVFSSFLSNIFSRFKNFYFIFAFAFFPTVISALFAYSTNLTLRQGRHLAFEEGTFTIFGLAYYLGYYAAFGFLLLMIRIIADRLGKGRKGNA